MRRAPLAARRGEQGEGARREQGQADRQQPEQAEAQQQHTGHREGHPAPTRMQKDYRIVPRGLALVIGCNTFPTWNAYPGIFASLVTGNPEHEVATILGRDQVSVFVPTTPNITAGFFLVVPRSETIELDMTVDEALKYIISMGVAEPLARQMGETRQIAPTPR